MAKFTFLQYVRSQWTQLPPAQIVDLSRQTVVVTGSNTGLGLEAAKYFARMDPEHLVLVCRSQPKGEKAIDEIKAETGLTPELLIMDMSEFASVSAFATTFQNKYHRLDILVCNAAVATPNSYEVTSDGWESTVQVNHLSTALVALLLLPLLVQTGQKAGHARLTFVSSGAHHFSSISPEVRSSASILEKVSTKEYFEHGELFHVYNLSKLISLQWTRAMNAHLPSTLPLVVDMVDPGHCYSGVRRNVTSVQRMLFSVMDFVLARSTPEGAKTLVWAATAGHDDVATRDSLKGAYIGDCQISEPSDFLFTAEGTESEKRVWSETLEILKKADPRVQDIAGEYLTA